MVRRENSAAKVHEPNKQSPDASTDGTELEAEANITYTLRSDFFFIRLCKPACSILQKTTSGEVDKVCGSFKLRV